MVQEARCVVQAEEKGADQPAAALIPEAADHAIGGTPPFHFQHGALARAIGQLQFLGNHAIERFLPRIQPRPSLSQLARVRRELHTDGVIKAGKQLLEDLPSSRKRLVQ